jgi:hypothetical protein
MMAAPGFRDGYRSAKRQGKPNLIIARKPRKSGVSQVPSVTGAYRRLRPIHRDA